MSRKLAVRRNRRRRPRRKNPGRLMGVVGIAAGFLGGFAVGGLVGPALTGQPEQGWPYGFGGALLGASTAHLLMR